VQRKTFIHRAASPGRCGAALANQRCRRHLAAGHTVDGVVYEEHRDLFSAIRGMNDFRGADCGEVTVTLVRDYDFAGTGALQARCGSGRPSMCNLHIAYVKIVISKDRAADGTDEHGLVLQSQVFNGLGD